MTCKRSKVTFGQNNVKGHDISTLEARNQRQREVKVYNGSRTTVLRTTVLIRGGGGGGGGSEQFRMGRRVQS